MYRSVILIAFLASAVQAETINGRIDRIVDGDSLILTDTTHHQWQIRLLGIDAPELTQAFGQNAKTALAAVAMSQSGSADCRLESRPNAPRCIVRVDGKDIGLEMVRAGMAWWDRQNSAQQATDERAAYEHAEFLAKIHRFGLWNDKNPTPPWEWRRGRMDD